MGTRPQHSLSGSVPVSALRSIADFHLGGDQRALQQMRAALETVYTDDVLGQDTLSIMDTLQTLDPLTYTPIRDTKYPDSEFGLALKQTASSLKPMSDLKSQPLTSAAGTHTSHKVRLVDLCQT